MSFPPFAIAGGGLIIGLLVGYFARRANLCTLGAIESALVGHDWRRMKVFGLSLALALALTQGLVLAGLFEPIATSYVPSRVAFLSIFAGSVMFGLGMALVGTCAFGSLLRLGGGDLRSLITIIVYAVAATMTLRGALASFRIEGLEAIALTMPGERPSALPDLARQATGISWRAVLTVAFVVALGLPAVLDRSLRLKRRLLRAGIVLGLGIAGGWALTGVLADPFESLMRVQSLTFVAPVARGLNALVFGTREWIDFGVMSVVGVTLGAFIAARQGDELRWEAFDDHVEMRRHLFGAVLMGVGGVLAGGCTIGQGLTAGSLLALSWPVAVVGIMLGARVGLAVLIADSLGDALRSLLGRGD
ncbi:MAG: YeeE/YedE family protein [Proteobacteria bacterium]|nr:YeeE/YedE family protein [Pseudomonadota bacterium]